MGPQAPTIARGAAALSWVGVVVGPPLGQAEAGVARARARRRLCALAGLRAERAGQLAPLSEPGARPREPVERRLLRARPRPLQGTRVHGQGARLVVRRGTARRSSPAPAGEQAPANLVEGLGDPPAHERGGLSGARVPDRSPQRGSRARIRRHLDRDVRARDDDRSLRGNELRPGAGRRARIRSVLARLAAKAVRGGASRRDRRLLRVRNGSHPGRGRDLHPPGDPVRAGTLVVRRRQPPRSPGPRRVRLGGIRRAVAALVPLRGQPLPARPVPRAVRHPPSDVVRDPPGVPRTRRPDRRHAGPRRRRVGAREPLARAPLRGRGLRRRDCDLRPSQLRLLPAVRRLPRPPLPPSGAALPGARPRPGVRASATGDDRPRGVLGRLGDGDLHRLGRTDADERRHLRRGRTRAVPARVVALRPTPGRVGLRLGAAGPQVGERGNGDLRSRGVRRRLPDDPSSETPCREGRRQTAARMGHHARRGRDRPGRRRRGGRRLGLSLGRTAS